MSILDEILRRTRADVLDRRARVPLEKLRARCRCMNWGNWWANRCARKG